MASPLCGGSDAFIQRYSEYTLPDSRHLLFNCLIMNSPSMGREVVYTALQEYLETIAAQRDIA